MRLPDRRGWRPKTRVEGEIVGARPSRISRVDTKQAMNVKDTWLEVPEVWPVKNGYRQGWESFLRHVCTGTPHTSPLLAGAKPVQLAEACDQSHRERRWIDLSTFAV